MIRRKQLVDKFGEWYQFDHTGATRAIRFKTNWRTDWIDTGLETTDLTYDFAVSMAANNILRLNIYSPAGGTAYTSTNDGVTWVAV